MLRLLNGKRRDSGTSSTSGLEEMSITSSSKINEKNFLVDERVEL